MGRETEGAAGVADNSRWWMSLISLLSADNALRKAWSAGRKWSSEPLSESQGRRGPEPWDEGCRSSSARSDAWLLGGGEGARLLG